MSNSTLNQYKHQLSYTTCNEDSLSEIKALDIKKEDCVICITGSGGRTLNLLTAQPKKIISVDFNPIQNWMLELKMAAIKNLDYDNYCRFLGLEECNNRNNIFDKIAGDISGESRDFWNKNISMIKKGILYQGKFERHYKLSSEFIKLFRRRKVDKIFSFSELEEQKEYYYTKWDNKFWRFLLSLDASQSNYKRTINDPAYYMFVDNKYDYKSFFHDSLERAFTTGLANENHFLALTIDGSYKRAKILPLYLQKEYFNCLKENISKISIVTDGLGEYLSKAPDNSIDKFSISDVSGYLNDMQYEALIKEVIRTAKKDSVICTRNFIAKKEIPSRYQDQIIRDMSLEKELEKQDLAFVYSFIVGQIVKC